MDQSCSLEILQPNGRASSKGVTRRRRKDDLLLGDDGRREASWDGHGQQRHADLAGVEVAQKRLQYRSLAEGDRHVGMHTVPTTNDRGQGGHGQTLGAGKSQRPSGRLTHRARRASAMAARRRQRHAAGLASEQRRPGLALDCGELMEDRRLRRMQQSRSLSDRTRVRDGDQALQRTKGRHAIKAIVGRAGIKELMVVRTWSIRFGQK